MENVIMSVTDHYHRCWYIALIENTIRVWRGIEDGKQLTPDHTLIKKIGRLWTVITEIMQKQGRIVLHGPRCEGFFFKKTKRVFPVLQRRRENRALAVFRPIFRVT